MACLFVISINDGQMIGSEYADGPVEAVNAYYDGLDAFCAPADNVEASGVVRVCQVVPDFEDEVRDILDGSESDAGKGVMRLLENIAEGLWRTITVEFKGSDCHVRLA